MAKKIGPPSADTLTMCLVRADGTRCMSPFQLAAKLKGPTRFFNQLHFENFGRGHVIGAPCGPAFITRRIDLPADRRLTLCLWGRLGRSHRFRPTRPGSGTAAANERIPLGSRSAEPPRRERMPRGPSRSPSAVGLARRRRKGRLATAFVIVQESLPRPPPSRPRRDSGPISSRAMCLRRTPRRAPARFLGGRVLITMSRRPKVWLRKARLRTPRPPSNGARSNRWLCSRFALNASKSALRAANAAPRSAGKSSRDDDPAPPGARKHQSGPAL